MPCARRVVRVVADTNTVVSGVLYQGAERRLLDGARSGRIALYTSAVLLDELADVLPRSRFNTRVLASKLSVRQLVRRYARLATRIIPAEINPVIIEDPDDDAVLACALAAAANLIVSGDTRVRNLKHYHRIPIVNTTEALHRIEKQTSS